jgi:hypothetical protein
MAKEEEDLKGELVSKGEKKKKNSVLKKETNSLSCILGMMQQELAVLTTLVNARKLI